MKLAENNERLLHILLSEELAGAQPPDLSEKIMARAFPKYNRGLIIRWSIRTAAAAVVILSIGWLAFGIFKLAESPSYPDPVASGSVQLEYGSTISRGATLVATGNDGKLILGGYCNIAMEQGSRVRIQGQKKAEEIFLKNGKVECSVNKKVGTFAVQTEVGQVEVTGTVFSVNIASVNPTDPASQLMKVSVSEGSVRVKGEWGIENISAGQSQTFAIKPKKPVETNPDDSQPELNKMIGVVTGKGISFIMVRPDGQDDPIKFEPRWIGGQPVDGGGLDKKIIEAISGLDVGDKIELIWIQQDDKPRIFLFKVLYKAPVDDPVEQQTERMIKTPEVTPSEPVCPKPTPENNEKKPDDTKKPKEAARPNNPQTQPAATTKPKDPNPTPQAQRNTIPPLEEPVKDPPVQFNPTKPGEENATARGKLTGTVGAKGDAYIDIVSSLSGKAARYYPDIVSGGPNKDILKTIAALKVGDKVSIRWYVNDKLRLYSIIKLASAPTPPDQKQTPLPVQQTNTPTNNQTVQNPVQTPTQTLDQPAATPQQPTGGVKPGSETQGQKPGSSGQKPGSNSTKP